MATLLDASSLRAPAVVGASSRSAATRVSTNARRPTPTSTAFASRKKSMAMPTTTTTMAVPRSVVVRSRRAGANAIATALPYEAVRRPDHRRGRQPTTRTSAVRGPNVNFFNFFGAKDDADGDEEDSGTANATAVSYDLLDLGSGVDGAVRAAADVFERVDDVVMGGVSSSVIGPDVSGRDCLVWAGKCRVEGGGFTGGEDAAREKRTGEGALEWEWA